MQLPQKWQRKTNMKRFKDLMRETAVEPDVPSIAARTLKEKPNKEPMAKLKEGRLSQRHPLEGHEYHKKSNEALIHIAKDAHKAAEAMKGHNTDAENKYRDQANDSATVRHFRQKSGMPDWYKKKYGHMKEENDTTEKVEMVQSQLHFIKYACEEILEYIDDGGEIEEWYQVKVAKAFSEFESLHAFIEGESRRTGMKEETQHKVGDSVIANSKFFGKQKGVVTKIDKQSVHVKREGKKFSEKYPHDSVVKEETEKHPFVAVHAKKGMHQTHGSTSYEAAQNAAKHWKMKNTAGIDVYRADKKHVAEETEKLDEISAETKSTYTQKATKQVADLKPWTKKGEYKDIAKNIITRREKGIAMAKEEVEQLDELSLDTLKSAKDKLAGKAYDAHMDDNKSAAQHYASRALNVRRKIRQKEHQVNKEEVEQIDELSNELLGRYKDKAADDAMKADKEGDYKRGDKRFSGVVKATNKQFAAMRKKPFGEEVEELEEGENEQVKGGDPCWKGYEMVGMKKKNGKKVPNCVPTNEEKQEPPFDPDPPKKRQVVPGKHGAAYSTARHLARQALKKQAEKMKPVKESLDESRKAEIVKEIVKKKKNEKNDTDSFQKEPVLSSEITKA
jgi:hypothetical protein